MVASLRSTACTPGRTRRRLVRFLGEHMILGIIGWLAVALLVGFIASKVVNVGGDDPRLGFAAAGVGGIVAAVLYTVISGAGVSAWNPWSLLTAAIGAGVGVTTFHVVRSRTISPGKLHPS
jgi:uncharacterized membrane protein YeaQ/YmgE (transglycosylase-associated protein family)